MGKRVSRAFLLPVLSSLIAAILIGFGILRDVDRLAQDALYQHPGVPAADIAIIGIDEETLMELGPYGPGYRKVMARALEQLASVPEKMPAVVAVDILYEGQSDPEADNALAAAAEKLGCMVSASMAEYGEEIIWEDGHAVSRSGGVVVRYVEPYEALKRVSVQGHINAMLDSDGILRHALLYVTPDGNAVDSMAVTAARLYLEKNGKTLTMPNVNAGHAYIPYTGSQGTYSDGVSLYRLVSGQVSPDYWAGKIILIGPYAASMGDAYFTSIDKGMPMDGVECQANVIQSLLDGSLKEELLNPPQLVVLFLLGAAAMVFFLRLKVAKGGAVCLILMLLSVGLSAVFYRRGLVVHVLWLPSVFLLLYLTALVVHYFDATRERQALALENERISTELALAARIQANSLPAEFPDRPEFEICASMTPAKEVGGDLYDFFLVDDDHLALVIGDVSGKGVPAALFMMLSSTLIHHVAKGERSPAKILQQVNTEICSRNPEEMFVTVWLGVLELSTGRLTAVNAGHEYPAVMSPNGHFELLRDKHGLVVGAMDGTRYHEYELLLAPGTRLFVYTDGVPEATNAAEEMFGKERMLAALQKRERGRLTEILAEVRGAVTDFAGNAQQFDDLTMLCLEYRGDSRPGKEKG